MNSPYDVLRPMQCRNTIDGQVCGKMLGEIDWSAPQTQTRRCLKCKAINLVHIVEAVVRAR